MSELIKCPFCGAEVKVYSYRLNHKVKSYRYHVGCSKCRAQSDEWSSKAKAIDSWNQGNIIIFYDGKNHWKCPTINR